MHADHPDYPLWLIVREALQDALPQVVRDQLFFAGSCSDVADQVLAKLAVKGLRLDRVLAHPACAQINVKGD